MTWEEFCQQKKEMKDTDPHYESDTGDALKAFADELVKRMDAHQFWANVDPTDEVQLRASDVKQYIKTMLNEAGVER